MRELCEGVGDCNVKIRIGTRQCLIICVLFPNNFHIQFVYFHLCSPIFTAPVSFYIHFLSTARQTLSVACTLISSILSDLSLSSFTVWGWAILSSAFLEYNAEILKHSQLWFVCYWQGHISCIRIMDLLTDAGNPLFKNHPCLRLSDFLKFIFFMRVCRIHMKTNHVSGPVSMSLSQ